MKILFFIYVSAGGRGGHFHSLNHISNEISNYQNNEIGIITFGREKSQVLVNNQNFLKHIKLSRSGFFAFYLSLGKMIKEFNPDVLHFFDAHSFNVYYPLSFFSKRKIVLNKCGGGNPIKYPIVQNLILFTEENKKWFEKNNHYKNSFLSIIPNRVAQIIITKQFDIIKNESYFNFVRICRIGSTYFSSIINSINIIKNLTDIYKLKIRLYIIGKILDEEVYSKIIEYVKGYDSIIFITDDKYTKEASQMLYLADAVIGTGRGAMEACSMGLPVLIPNNQIDVPLLLTSDKFEICFEYNFTARAKFEGLEQNIEIEKIKNMMTDNSEYQKISNFSFNTFEKYFDIKQVPKYYNEVYRNAKSEKSSIKIVFNNLLRFLSTISRVFRKEF